MSDIMRPIPFAQLMDWVLGELKNQGSLFGVKKIVRHENGQTLPIFDEKIESPYGPAAGPHTQLAQNIIAAYAAGSRFFELKTVQIMDGETLAKCVAKPCIAAGDECYNCEWSTELTVPQAFEEYVKAWVACKVLAREANLGDPDGFVFNMSVGYDLKGIMSPKIDAYIEGMKNAECTPIFAQCCAWLLENLDRFAHIDEAFVKTISPRISSSITESTLHGCPPDEIERIATYLITKKHLNTYVKCNPTLLGYAFVRARLDSLGFDYVAFDDHHFAEDLQWADAVPMFHRLMALCAQHGLEFGVKLTNTCPVDVTAGELPSAEMYMSGRSLYPLTIALAHRVSEAFGGRLRISYSGGADVRNIAGLFKAGIWPITMATTVLKPGGYERMSQIAERLMDCGSAPFAGVSTSAVQALEDAVTTDVLYHKPIKPLPNRKNGRRVPLIDCFDAPCRSGCPIEQDIPAYLMALGEGRYADALRIILSRNALPFITGTICPHHCADKCMRNAYEEPVRIRAAKLKAAQRGIADVLPTLTAETTACAAKVAVVGGGPAGLAAASFLSRAGAAVTVFEREKTLGGIVRHVIPSFRIDEEAIENDIALCKAYGAEFVTGREIASIAELTKAGYTDVIVAVGAWQPGAAGLKYGESMNVIRFLKAVKCAPQTLSLGRQVVVIGGGNTAMDAARAAKRMPGVEQVRLVYRRTKRYMPAEEEELALALADGVQFMELLAPIGLADGKLTCDVMTLGAPDASGRRSPVPTGKTLALEADTVIAAVGERIDDALYTACGAALDAKGRPVVSASLEIMPHVYAIGDCRRGPATVVEAIADAARAAKAIADIDFARDADKNVGASPEKALLKRGSLCDDCDACTDSRCLGCATVCETCASVCPNRANVSIVVPGRRQHQILHVDGMCNECGNCAVFCPYDSKPYKDKFTLYWRREDFEHSTNAGCLPLGGSRVLVRLGNDVKTYDAEDAACGLDEAIRQLILAVFKDYRYLLAK